MSLFPSHHKQIERLRLQRREVTEELTSAIQEFAPKLWADFESRRLIPGSAFSHDYSSSDSRPTTPTGTSRRLKSSYGPESSILQHPMSWIDEKLFGWSTKSTRRRHPSDSDEYIPTPSEPVTPGYRTESDDERADYDDVVRAVEEKLKDVNGGDSKRLRRRSSGARSRSQLNLSELAPSDGMSTAVQKSAGKAEQRTSGGYEDEARDH